MCTYIRKNSIYYIFVFWPLSANLLHSLHLKPHWGQRRKGETRADRARSHPLTYFCLWPLCEIFYLPTLFFLRFLSSLFPLCWPSSLLYFFAFNILSFFFFGSPRFCSMATYSLLVTAIFFSSAPFLLWKMLRRLQFLNEVTFVSSASGTNSWCQGKTLVVYMHCLKCWLLNILNGPMLLQDTKLMYFLIFTVSFNAFVHLNTILSPFSGSTFLKVWHLVK